MSDQGQSPSHQIFIFERDDSLVDGSFKIEIVTATSEEEAWNMLVRSRRSGLDRFVLKQTDDCLTARRIASINAKRPI